MFRCEVPPWAVKLPAFTSCKSKRCWHLQGELWRIQTSKYATWKSLLSSHPNLENPYKLALESPQCLTFKIPENLLFCFCAYPEALSRGRRDEKCFMLAEVHTDSPTHQEAQPDQAFLETAYGIPQRYLWQMCSTGCSFPWKCAQMASHLNFHTAMGDRFNSLPQLKQFKFTFFPHPWNKYRTSLCLISSSQIYLKAHLRYQILILGVGLKV